MTMGEETDAYAQMLATNTAAQAVADACLRGHDPPDRGAIRRLAYELERGARRGSSPWCVPGLGSRVSRAMADRVDWTAVAESMAELARRRGRTAMLLSALRAAWRDAPAPPTGADLMVVRGRTAVVSRTQGAPMPDYRAFLIVDDGEVCPGCGDSIDMAAAATPEAVQLRHHDGTETLFVFCAACGLRAAKAAEAVGDGR